MSLIEDKAMGKLSVIKSGAPTGLAVNALRIYHVGLPALFTDPDPQPVLTNVR